MLFALALPAQTPPRKPAAALPNTPSTASGARESTASAARPIAPAPASAPYSLAAASAAVGPALTVDAASGRHAISPDVYGVNSYGNVDVAAALHLPLTRWGGNATSQYNWLLDASNSGGDWYFEVFPQNGSADAAKLPDGSAHDVFHEANLAAGARSYSTVPIMDWVAGTRVSKTCSFSVKKYGAQKATDPYGPDCGNGTLTSGVEVNTLSSYTPTDADVQVDAAFITAWVKHMTAKYGTAAQGGVAVWSLDNEPMWWMANHKNIHPSPFNYDELAERGIRYAQAIKAGDPTALVAGPVSAGYQDLFFSAVDVKAGWSTPNPKTGQYDPNSYWYNPVDRKAHGDLDLTAWYLRQFAQFERTHGYRLLDYLDVHAYMPGTGGDDISDAGKAARLQAPRVLWDPSYVFSHFDYLSNEPVNLIGRMKNWIAGNYPGTKMALTEYNFGAFQDITGALAQADALGVFGREGVDVATLWGEVTSTISIADPANSGKSISVPNLVPFAFALYRNYDGRGSAFGETSVAAATADQTRLTVYAAERSDSALTLMVINKTSGSLQSAIALNSFEPDSTAQACQFSAANPGGIVRAPDVSTTANGLTATFPAYSATLLVIPAAPDSLKAPKPVIASVVNAASGQAGVAPGTLVKIAGANLGPQSGASSPILGQSGFTGTTLANVAVLFNGVPAPVLSASAGAVTAVVPYTAGLQATAAVQVQYLGSRSDAVQVPIAAAAPGIFAADGSGQGAALAFSFDPALGILALNSPLNPAPAGARVFFYVTGAGALNPPAVDGRIEGAILPKPAQPLSVTIGGVTATAQAASAPGSVSGILLVNVTVPGGVAPGAAPLVVTVGSASSRGSVTLAVK